MRFLLACSLAGLLQVPLRAAVSERDLISPGDGLLTYDDTTHREWLDLTQTAAVDLSVVKDALKPGGQWAGFHFATGQDAEALAISAGVQPSPEPEHFSIVVGTQARRLNALVGKIILRNGDILGEGSIALGQIVRRFEGDTPIFDDMNFFVVSGNDELEEDSSPLFAKPGGAYLFSTPLNLSGFPPLGRGSTGPFWLYRQAVPEPGMSGLWLLVLGALMRRRHPLTRT